MEDDLKEVQRLKDNINNSSIPDGLKENLMVLLDRVARSYKYGNYSRDYESAARYITWILSVPWGNFSQDNMDLQNAKTILDKDHYGMNAVKERILEYIAVMNLKKQDARAPIICFVGLQGIGKTSMAHSISIALGRSFERISIGGMPSALELLGRSKSNVDSEPGLIVRSLIKAKTMNPVILLDEVEKAGSDIGSRASVMASLLEILDPEQNETFMDNYIDFPINLSKTIFILTANNLGPISSALLDRLEIVKMTGYTDEEKQVIAKDYILPKLYNEIGISSSQLTFEDDIWPNIIRPLGYEAGIRELERVLMGIGRKVAKQFVTDPNTKIHITKENLKEYIEI